MKKTFQRFWSFYLILSLLPLENWPPIWAIFNTWTISFLLDLITPTLSSYPGYFEINPRKIFLTISSISISKFKTHFEINSSGFNNNKCGNWATLAPCPRSYDLLVELGLETSSSNFTKKKQYFFSSLKNVSCLTGKYVLLKAIPNMYCLGLVLRG